MLIDGIDRRLWIFFGFAKKLQVEFNVLKNDEPDLPFKK
jgi:hypothetical protein